MKRMNKWGPRQTDLYLRMHNWTIWLINLEIDDYSYRINDYHAPQKVRTLLIHLAKL